MYLFHAVCGEKYKVGIHELDRCRVEQVHNVEWMPKGTLESGLSHKQLLQLLLYCRSDFIVILRTVYFMTANHAAIQRPVWLLLKFFSSSIFREECSLNHPM